MPPARQADVPIDAGPRESPGGSCSFSVTWRIALATTLLWLLPRLVLLRWTGPPEPRIQDEFSYLLGADTFVHGRLSNPPHPMGRFFESPHILITPTYASKYQPGQALWLALGERLFGHPVAGVVLEGSAMAFSFAVLFCAWVSPKWAAAFSLATALCFQWPMAWVNSYWGGCVAAIGAALLLTAIGHLKGARVTPLIGTLSGFTLGAGVILLVLSRPYEGGVLTVAAVLSLLWRVSSWKRLSRPAVSALIVVIPCAWWVARYDRAVTGEAAKLPYVVHAETYNVAPVFWFLPLHPEPAYRQPRLALQHGLHGWEVQEYHRARVGMRHLGGFLRVIWVVLRVLGPLLGFVLLLPLCWRGAVAVSCTCPSDILWGFVPGGVEVFALPGSFLPLRCWLRLVWRIPGRCRQDAGDSGGGALVWLPGRWSGAWRSWRSG